MISTLRIGTRASKLAMAQAKKVKEALMLAHKLPEESIVIVPMTTAGDRDVQANPAHWGFKGLFTKELEEALLDKRVDLAVHSMKDMPSELPPGLTIAAMLPRADVRDAWISTKHASYTDLPAGAVIGTSSARRAAQLKHRHPHVTVVPFRGNVETRLRKLDEGVAEATFLACAGLQRLQLLDAVRHAIPVEDMLPAVAQGAIGIECRDDDALTRALLSLLDDSRTHQCVAAERAFLHALDGSCRTPIAGLAVLDGNAMHLHGEVLSLDGSVRHYQTLTTPAADALQAGEDLGRELRALAGEALLKQDHA